MANKNCPTCEKSNPVACKRCVCGHNFTRRKRIAGPPSPGDGTEIDATMAVDTQTLGGGGGGTSNEPLRRTGRVQREPQFYDSLQYETQTRQKKYAKKEVPKIEKVFVTVGTTSFDELVHDVCKLETLKAFEVLKTKHIRIQVGLNSKWDPEIFKCWRISFEIYQFKDNYREDIEWADLVIAHGGAGTIMDTLELGKPLIVVPNSSLMVNHQLELASELQNNNHLVVSDVTKLAQTLKKFKAQALVPLCPVNPQPFLNSLYNVLDVKQEDVIKLANENIKFSITDLVKAHDEKKKRGRGRPPKRRFTSV